MHEKTLQALQEARLKRLESGIKTVIRNPIEKSLCRKTVSKNREDI